MGLIRLIAAPIRSILRSRLFQIAVVIIIILLLQAADDNSLPGRVSDGLDKLVDKSLQLVSELFRMKSFTRSVLTAGLMIAYIYLVCLLIFFLLRGAIRITVDLVGRTNFLWLRKVIAHERGIAAYRAWEPLERIRPAYIAQKKWEETFAWPADNRPPYPPLPQRILRGLLGYAIVILAAAVLLQIFTPFPILTWLGKLTRVTAG